MMSFTHTVFGVLILELFGSVLGIEITTVVIAVAVLFSLLPDIDHPRSAVGILLFPFSKFISERYGHRTITHSMMTFIPLCIFALVLIPVSGVPVAFAMVVGYLSHLISDGMTEMGCPLLYPDPRPFWFLPKSLLVKTGSWQEFAFFGITSLFVVATTGISSFGLRSILHMITPSFHGAYDDFCRFCDGDGEKSLCIVRAEVCDENVCGEVEGIGLGLMMGNLVLYKNGTYLVIRDRTTNAVRVDRLKEIEISSREFQFERKPFSYIRGELSGFKRYSTVSGVLEFEDLVCDNCNEFGIPDDVLRISYDRIIIHHLLVEDFQKLEIHGFIKSGHLTVKVKDER
ncbi:MAG: hypothetical protein B5M53_04455 [Candidatus Cloacimonas sp. 4484_209]|nr:MAG: hypothetical protein B5M53_04455 [Candidatus Cloacimonas sp. 4484_209]